MILNLLLRLFSTYNILNSFSLTFLLSLFLNDFLLFLCHNFFILFYYCLCLFNLCFFLLFFNLCLFHSFFKCYLRRRILKIQLGDLIRLGFKTFRDARFPKREILTHKGTYWITGLRALLGTSIGLRWRISALRFAIFWAYLLFSEFDHQFITKSGTSTVEYTLISFLFFNTGTSTWGITRLEWRHCSES